MDSFKGGRSPGKSGIQSAGYVTVDNSHFNNGLAYLQVTCKDEQGNIIPDYYANPAERLEEYVVRIFMDSGASVSSSYESHESELYRGFLKRVYDVIVLDKNTSQNEAVNDSSTSHDLELLETKKVEELIDIIEYDLDNSTLLLHEYNQSGRPQPTILSLKLF